MPWRSFASLIFCFLPIHKSRREEGNKKGNSRGGNVGWFEGEERCHFNDAGRHDDKVVRPNVWVGVGVGDNGALGEDFTGLIGTMNPVDCVGGRFRTGHGKQGEQGK